MPKSSSEEDEEGHNDKDDSEDESEFGYLFEAKGGHNRQDSKESWKPATKASPTAKLRKKTPKELQSSNVAPKPSKEDLEELDSEEEEESSDGEIENALDASVPPQETQAQVFPEGSSQVCCRDPQE